MSEQRVMSYTEWERLMDSLYDDFLSVNVMFRNSMYQEYLECCGVVTIPGITDGGEQDA